MSIPLAFPARQAHTVPMTNHTNSSQRATISSKHGATLSLPISTVLVDVARSLRISEDEAYALLQSGPVTISTVTVTLLPEGEEG